MKCFLYTVACVAALGMPTLINDAIKAEAYDFFWGVFIVFLFFYLWDGRIGADKQPIWSLDG